MKRFIGILVVLGIGLGGWAVLRWHRTPTPVAGNGALQIYCAAGMKNPVEAIAGAYRKEFGLNAELEYGGTGSLLSQIRVSNTGDLFVAADDGAIADARKLGLVREVMPLARQTPVIAVQKGNPRRIHALDDLLKEEVKFALANPESASIGRVTKRVLGERWATFSAKAAVLKPTVMDIAGDLKLGAVDAAIIWDSAAAQFPELEAVVVPEFAGAAENASIAVLSSCTQPDAALQFVRYITSPEKGAPTFTAKGFKPAPGDKWSEKPQEHP